MTTARPRKTSSANAAGQEPTERLARNARTVLLVSTIAFFALSLFSTIVTIALGEYVFVGTVSMGIIGVISLVGLFLNTRGKFFAGIFMIAGAIMLASMMLPFLVNGSGVNIGLAGLLMIAGLATYALPPDRALRITIAAAIVAMLTALIDLYTPFYLNRSNPNATLVFTALLLTVYVVFIIRRFRVFPVRAKIVIMAVAVAVTPLIILSIVNNLTSTRKLDNDARQALSASALQAAHNLESLIDRELDIVRAEAHLPQVIQYLQLEPLQRTEQISAELNSLLIGLQRRDPTFISSYALLDRYGRDIADTDPGDIGSNKSGRDYFIQARDTNLPHITSVYYSPTTGSASFFVSAPIRDENREFLGVLRVRYDADYLQYFLVGLSENQVAGEQGRSQILVDENYYTILANTGQPQTIGSFLLPYEGDQLEALHEARLLPEGSTSAPTTNQPELVAGLRNIDLQPVFSAPSELTPGEPALVGTARVRNTSWIVLIEQPSSIVTVPVRQQTRAATTIALGAAALAALASLLASQPIAGPIVRLTNAARAVSEGDLNARAVVETEDELGTLAAVFNQMTGQLSDTLAGLEKRVAERTADLEKTSRTNQERANSLAAINEVTRAIAAEQELEKLLPLITHVVSERFGFYHVGIFLVDEQRQFALLRAANSEGGQRMLARGHRLRIGQEGIVGFVTSAGRARIALDVGADATFFNNPDLPTTRSEMALPLILRGQIIGALDVQSSQPQAFTEADAETMSILAVQIAIAIDNARLFDETRLALTEAQALYSEYQAQAWQNIARRQNIAGFRHGPGGSQPLLVPVQRAEIDQAITAGDVIVTQPSGQDHAILAVPIKLREQIIGVLNIRAQQADHVWSPEEVELVRSVSARVALALENARLLEETRQRANRERLVADITTRIRASNDPQVMMQTAVEELKAALGATRVEIVPQSIAPRDNEA